MPRKSTRNAQGAGSLRQRSDGTWEARYTVGRDPGTGKQIRKSVYGKTQKEARQKLSQAIAALDSGTYFEPSKITLGKWLDIWLAEYTGDKKYLTVKHYTAQVNTHIKPGLGSVRLAALTPPQIQKFYNDLLERGQSAPKRDDTGKIVKKDGKTVYTDAPMSPKSVRNIHGILTKALSTAVQVGYLRINPAAAVTLPRVEKKEIRPLTDQQVKALLDLADEDEFGIVFKVIVLTGLRESEALGLTWDCVDFREGTVRITKQLQKRPNVAGGFVFAPLKNDKTRSLTPAPYVMDLLKAHWQTQAEQRLRAGELWEGWASSKERETALVFTNAFGGHLHPQTLYNHFKKLAAQVGAPEACVHDLRHTFAVLSPENGDDVKTVQGNLGHATAAFTLDVYGHVSERMKTESAARMQTFLYGLKVSKG